MPLDVLRECKVPQRAKGKLLRLFVWAMDQLLECDYVG